jgi:lysozyme family protein
MTSTGTIGSDRFLECVDFVLRHETEYNADGSVRVERDKRDPGGTTKYGIDQRSHPDVSVENLSLADAKKIYFDDEWTKCRCGELKAPWDLALFDAAVNVGSHRAVRWLQEAVGAEKDGFIGPKTIAKANAADEKSFDRFIERRKFYYTSEVKTSLRLTYLKGWLNRVADLVKTSTIETDSMPA